MKRGGPLARGAPLARRTQLATRRPWRPRAPRTMAASPDGPRACRLAALAQPGPCWGALHRHHVLPRGRGGADVPDNLAWLCAWHHQWVHAHPPEGRALGLLA